MQRYFALALLSFSLSACSSIFEKDTEVRSPCVAIDPSVLPNSSYADKTTLQHPCARRPVNAAWIG